MVSWDETLSKKSAKAPGARHSFSLFTHALGVLHFVHNGINCLLTNSVYLFHSSYHILKRLCGT